MALQVQVLSISSSYGGLAYKAFKVRARHLWQIDGKRNKSHLHCFLLVYAVLVISSGAIYAPLQRLQGRSLPGLCSCHVLRMPRACLRKPAQPLGPTDTQATASCMHRALQMLLQNMRQAQDFKSIRTTEQQDSYL